MFATSPFYYPTATHAYLPTTPSPLSPRSANIYGRPPPHAQSYVPSSSFMSTPAKHQTPLANTDVTQNENTTPHPPIFTFSSPPSTTTTVPFSKRPIKKAPTQKPNELRERRRGAFLRKVREGREEGRFESRGEDIMRLEFLRGRRAWEAQLAKEAEGFVDEEPEERGEEERGWETGLPESSRMVMSGPSTQQPWDEVEAEEALMREQGELEALIEYLPGEGPEVGQGEEQNLWSDDDYDALFSEFVEQDGGTGRQLQRQQQGQQPPELPMQEGGEAMDMS